MKLEKQVTSLKLSKKLKELGVKQESLWCWINMYPSGGDTDDFYTLELGHRENSKSYSAFTVAELGEKLKKYDIDYWYSYPDFRLKLSKEVDTQGRDENEANARAEMLIYLIENKLIKKGNK